MGQLTGKTALVAGAGRNNGKAISIAFAREGADLILVAREKKDSLNEVAKECEKLGAKVLPIMADVSDHEQVERLVQQGLERFGQIDVLMSCAGRRAHQDFWQISYEEWHKTFEVNLHSLFYLAKAVAPSMMARKTGSIIALGGQASVTSQPQRAHVIASKHGLFGLIKALALELGPYNVRANLIALMSIENVRANPEWYADGIGRYTEADLAAIPLKRAGKPQEVANVAVFLASEQSSYVTGDRILCGGGKYM
jgi:NAD(P)-dependent dehydrogenase (short-subunit alcohol dehydrogenase family)